MLLPLRGLLRQKGTLELLLLFAVAAVSVDPVSSAGAMELGELDANHRCVAGKMGGIPGQGGRGLQDVTADGGQTVVKLEGTPKDTFRAMVRSADQLHYELIVDHEEKQRSKCGEAIKGLVEAEGCVAGKWHEGNCDGGKCTGGGIRVSCGLSNVQQVQDDSGPTGYSLTDVNVWSSEKCLSVSAKFTNTDTNFCYLVRRTRVPEGQLKETKTVGEFSGRISTTEATTTTSTAATKETNATTEGISTTTPTGNTTTAETTTQGPTTTKGTEKTTSDTADGPPTGPTTTKDPAGFRLAWYYWVIASVAVLVLVVVVVGLGALYLLRRRRRVKQQKEDVEADLGSDPAQSGSDGKTTKAEASKSLKKAVVVEEYDELEGVKEDTKDDGHKQVKSAQSHYLTQSAKKSEESGEKKEDETTVKAPPQKGISVPSSSSISEAAEKKKTKSTNTNGYEKVGSTLLADAGIGKKEEAKNGEYEVLPTL